MKTITILFLVLFQFAKAQGNLYVSAENGLNVREDASVEASIKGKFYYGDTVYQLLPAKDSIALKIDGKEVKGTWMMVSGINEKQENIQGYVFSGFLSEVFIPKPILVPLKKGEMKIIGTDGYYNDTIEPSLYNKTAMVYSYNIGYAENLKLKINIPNARKTEVYQRLDSSVIFNVHNLECDALRQGIIKSDWEKLHKRNDAFLIKKYSTEDTKLNKKAWSKMEQKIKQECPKTYLTLKKMLSETESEVIYTTPNFVSFKIIITDENGNETIERIDSGFFVGC